MLLIWNYLQGKKTYIVGILTVIWGLLGFALKQLDFQTATNIVLAGLAILGFRSAITKIQ